MSNIKVVLKKWWLRTGQHGKTGHSETIENTSVTTIGASETISGVATLKSGESQTTGRDVPLVENPDPEKNHLRLPRRIGWLERRIRRARVFWKPELTPLEKDILEQKRRNRAIRATMNREMGIANKIIPNAYAGLGIQYQRQSKKGFEKEKIERVRFSKWTSSADGNTIYGKVCKVPYGHSPAELVRDDVLTALSFSLGHPVGGKCGDKGEGVIIWVSLAGTMDIPDLAKFDETFPLISSSAPPLSVFIGIGENSAKHIYNLEELPHLLIGGSTGSGKSVMLTSILATIVARNSPNDVRFLLADLKRIDLVHFEGIPHLIQDIPEIPTGIVTEDKQIIPLFHWLEKENNRRQDLFGKERVRSLAEWNRRNRAKHLPRIVVAIDEFARLMRSELQKKEFISLTYDLASTARATGIYLILATQFAKDKYVSTDIKMNIPGRVAFSVPDLQGSVSLIDSNEAVNLYPPAGRGIFCHGVNKYKFQAPFISSSQIAGIVKSAKEGKILSTILISESISEEDLISWALNSNNGLLQTYQAFHQFTPRVTEAEVKKILQNMDNKKYLFEGVEYQVIPAVGGRARQLQRVEAGEPIGTS